MLWAGKTAVVTGVARPTGIGHACAQLLYRHGYNVVGIDRADALYDASLPWVPVQNVSRQDTAPQQVQADRPHCVLLQLDLADATAVMSVGRHLQNLGITRVHVLVNNAGIADPCMPPAADDGSSAQARAQLWSKYIAVNLSAAFLLTEALLPLLSQQQTAAAGSVAGAGRDAGQQPSSSVLHISSTRALQSEPNCEGYAASKAGLVGLTHSQAASLAGMGIRVNAVLPGWIDTSDTNLSGEETPLRPEDHAWHWVGRVGRPADIAEMVAFLADSSKSGFVTGQQFVVDGGVTKRMVYPE